MNEFEISIYISQNWTYLGDKEQREFNIFKSMVE